MYCFFTCKNIKVSSLRISSVFTVKSKKQVLMEYSIKLTNKRLILCIKFIKVVSTVTR